jgi:hypothetical protein
MFVPESTARGRTPLPGRIRISRSSSIISLWRARRQRGSFSASLLGGPYVLRRRAPEACEPAQRVGESVSRACAFSMLLRLQEVGLLLHQLFLLSVSEWVFWRRDWTMQLDRWHLR